MGRGCCCRLTDVGAQEAPAELGAVAGGRGAGLWERGVGLWPGGSLAPLWPPRSPGAAEGRGRGSEPSFPWLRDRGSWGPAGVCGRRAPAAAGSTPRTLSGAQGQPLRGARVAPNQQEGWQDLHPRPLLGGITAHLSHQSGGESEWTPGPPPAPCPTSSVVPCKGDLPTQSKGQGGTRVGRRELGQAGGGPSELGAAGRCLDNLRDRKWPRGAARAEVP